MRHAWGKETSFSAVACPPCPAACACWEQKTKHGTVCHDIWCHLAEWSAEACQPCRSSSGCQPLSAPLTRQLQTRNLLPWGSSTARTVCHAGVCVPEAAEQKDSFCDRLRGLVAQPAQLLQQELGAAGQQQGNNMQEQGEVQVERRALQEQMQTLQLAPAPAPMMNITVPAVRHPIK